MGGRKVFRYAALLLVFSLSAVPGDLLSSANSPRPEPLITLSFNGARLPAVVGALARQSGMSFIIAPELSQIDVTVDLEAVPFSSALESFAREYSFCLAQPRDDVVALKLCAPPRREKSFEFGGVIFRLPFWQAS
jgi:type II secretory pathway component GspD/PulD (secretin)